MAGHQKHHLGDLFGLANFGVNLTSLAPTAVSALHHAHSKQDEFIYILQGSPTLEPDEGRIKLTPDMCAGFISSAPFNFNPKIPDGAFELCVTKQESNRPEPRYR